MKLPWSDTSANKDETPSEIFKRVDAAEGRKQVLSQRWKEVLAFFHNEQWIQYSPTSKTFTQYHRSRGSQVTINVLASHSSAIVGMLTQGKPIPSCEPMSGLPADEEKAKYTDALLNHVWDTTRMVTKLEDAALWEVLTGTCFAKVYWDPDVGPVELDEDGVPQRVGELRVDILPPFSVGFCDTTTFDKSPWIYHYAIYTPEELERRFPDAGEIKPDAFPEDSLNGGVIRFDVTKGGNTPTGVSVVEWWERPSRKYPEGQHLICTREKTLMSEGWPDTAPWPIHMCILFPVPGSPWGDTTVRAMVPAQKALNYTVSEVIDHISMAANPGLLSKKGTVPPGQKRGPGANIEYDIRPGDPTPIQFSSGKLDEWVIQMPKMILDWCEAISRVSGVVQGNTPFSRISGRTVAYLTENAGKNFGNPAERFIQFIKDISMSMLELWRNHGPYEQSLKIAGNDGNYAWREFKRDEISYRSLKLTESQVLVGSKTARQETLERWAQNQWIDPQEFRQLMAKSGLVPDDVDVQALDKAWARRNIDLLRQGEIPPVKPYMMLPTHYEETAKYMKTAEFFTLDPQIQAGFEQHLGNLDATMNPPQQMPPEQGPTPQPDGTSPEAGIPGPIPSQGGQGAPPDLNGSTNPPGVDQVEEGQLSGMV
jgi:hypothetical protein